MYNTSKTNVVRNKTKISKTAEMIIIEWKEIARRIEYIMLFLSLTSIVICPVLLFGEFFIRDIITESHLSAPCGYDYSFVKNN